MTQHQRPQGMRAFLIIWFGQFVSTLGSGLTGFALGVWVYQQTGSAAQFALTTFFYVVPTAVVSSLAGAIADRWDRRWIVVLADAGQALTTLAIALLLYADRLEVAHIYLASVVNSVLGTFQGPAYTASVSLLVPRQHLARASGITQISQAVSRLASPAAAGVLMVTVGLQAIVLIDLATFLFAVAALLIVRIPRPEATPAAAEAGRTIWRELVFGWRYLIERPGLAWMVVIFSLRNLFSNAATILVVPLVLSFADADTAGAVLSVGGAGLLAGGLLISAWGGPKRLVSGALGFLLLQGLAIGVAGILPNAVLVGAGMAVYWLSFSVFVGCYQAVLQKKIAPDVQGRAFGTVAAISTLMEAPAYPAGGYLTDHVLEPLMGEGGALAGVLGPVIGTGPGRGIGLLYLLMGGCLLLLTAVGYLSPRIRWLEDRLPDAVVEAAPG